MKGHGVSVEAWGAGFGLWISREQSQVPGIHVHYVKYLANGTVDQSFTLMIE